MGDQTTTQRTTPVMVHYLDGLSVISAKYASTLSLVKGDIALGKQLNIKATPTFFINGVKIESAIAPQYFEQAIAYELQHAK